MARSSASTEPGGISQPLTPSTTSSGIPAICVAITGRCIASASISTTGSPSLRLGSTSARARASSLRTTSLPHQPSRRRPSPSPASSRSAVERGAGRRRSASARSACPRSCRRRTASISSGKPFSALRRPTKSRRGASGTGVAAPVRNSGLHAGAHPVDPLPGARRREQHALAAAEVADARGEGRRVDLRCRGPRRAGGRRSPSRAR